MIYSNRGMYFSQADDHYITLAKTDNYKTAESIVDYLSDRRFSVKDTAILAEGLRFNENITGRLNFGKALLRGATKGAILGLSIGLLLSIFSLGSAVSSIFYIVLWGVIYGAFVGAVLDAISYLMSGGKRDFTSLSSMSASSYRITVDSSKASEAVRLLEGSEFKSSLIQGPDQAVGQ